MFALDNPAITDGLPAWQAWAEQLTALAAQHPNDLVVADARRHAERVMTILAEYPEGLNARDPQFREVVRALRRATPPDDPATAEAKARAWAEANADFIKDYNARVERGELIFNDLRHF